MDGQHCTWDVGFRGHMCSGQELLLCSLNLHSHCLFSAWPWTGCLAPVYFSLITHETEIMMSPPEFP